MGHRGFEIATMSRADIDFALLLAAREGWNPGLHDADSFHAADPTGFLVGRLDGTPIGCVSAVRYGRDFGFLGLYIVEPAHRGSGYGLRLFEAGMSYLRGRTVGLDGVVSQQGNYAKFGFGLAYRNLRYRGSARSSPAGDTALVPLAGVAFDVIAAYDRKHFPAERRAFLKSWIQPTNGIALGVMLRGELRGYGVIRPCGDGHKIGPLFADASELAETLFAGLVGAVPASEPVFLDIPERNTEAARLVERHGMQLAFETARMYSGPPPHAPLDGVFGVTTFELG
jgi:GNAT superfamily N-acetyltransferase